MMGGDGFSKQMAETAKENLEKLKHRRLSREQPKVKYEKLSEEILNSGITEDKLNAIRNKAKKNQILTDLKSYLKIFLVVLLFLTLIILYVSGLFVRD